TDALLASLDADVVLLNVTGGLRSDLPAGPLTYGSVFRMFPFDNRVVILEMSGSDLRRIVAAQAHNHRRRMGFAGMQARVACADGQMIVEIELDDGRILEDRDTVRVAVNDFLATGGDRMLTPAMPAGGFTWSEDPRFARDVIADWFRRQDGTLDAADFVTANPARWHLPENLPADCRL
ncbi:MAG: 5'-nucleotidase, partial [Woeseiaceae bacterium]|nr:5'-nucleotidase [Woeseiaceae bacterium]